MERQVKRSVAKLPVVCFNGRDELTIEGYMVKANALSGGEVDLTSEDKKKIEYSLRVFKGLAASAANSVRLVEMPHERRTKRMGKHTTEIESLAQGCLVGAFVGDSAGARLEFLGRRPDNAQLDDALAMKGGGVFRVAPGQITDDGELTLALARALKGEQEYPREKVAINYRAWVASRPFDIGNATSAALSGAAVGDSEVADAVATNAAKHNFASKANGALMRASALGVWSVRRTFEEAVAAARADACLTHPNLTCQWASAAYVVAIRHLLLYPGDGAGAFAEAECALNGTTDDGIIEVQSWLKDAARGSLPSCYPLAGFVRIAFTHALHHLHCETPFEDALRQVLAGGGDTDTNACIVGGLVGARVGLEAIPEHMSRAVLECDTAKGRHRPPWLQTRDALTVATALLT